MRYTEFHSSLYYSNRTDVVRLCILVAYICSLKLYESVVYIYEKKNNYLSKTLKMLDCVTFVSYILASYRHNAVIVI